MDSILVYRRASLRLLAPAGSMKSAVRNRHRERGRAATSFLWVIVVLGLGLRLYHLGHQSIWYDEIFSITLSHYPIRQMLPYLVKDLVHPPLHYYILHIWFMLVGFGAYQSRLLSAVLGTAAIIAVYLLGRYLFDRWTAMTATLLLAVSQLAVMYSQEARSYSQFLLLVTICSYLFLVALRTGRAGPWWGFVATMILVVYTHYYGFLAVAAFLVFAVVYRKKYPVRISRWIGAAAVVLALYMPWLSSGVLDGWFYGQKGQLARSSSQANVHWWTFVTYINELNSGRAAGLLESAPWWTFLLGGVLFTVPAMLALKPLLQKAPAIERDHLLRENLCFLFLLFTIPLLAGLVLATLFYGGYGIRHLIFILVPYYLLVAHGISLLDHAYVRTALVTACVAYSIYALRANYFIPYKEDYRGAYAYLAKSHQAGDCYLVEPPWEERQAKWAWAIYHPEQPALQVMPQPEVGAGHDGCSRVWLISVVYRDTPPAVMKTKEAEAALVQEHVRVETEQFYSMKLELYVLKNQ